MVAQTVAGRVWPVFWDPGERDSPSGRGKGEMGGGGGGEVAGAVQWAATCGRKRGNLQAWGGPIRPPDPRAFQTAACLLLSLISPVCEWATSLSCGPSPQNVLATRSAPPLPGSIPPFPGGPRPLRMAPPFCPIPFPNKLLLGLRPQMPVHLQSRRAHTRMAPPLVQSRSSVSRLWTAPLWHGDTPLLWPRLR